MKNLLFICIVLSCAACHDLQPSARIESQSSPEVEISKDQSNWQIYLDTYADREQEITIGMIPHNKIDPVQLTYEYEPAVNRVTLRDSEGRTIWSRDTPKSVHSVRPPAWALSDDGVFVVQDQGLAKLDVVSGETIWESDGPNDILFAIGNLIIAGDCTSSPADGRWAVARDTDNGEVKWRVQLPNDVEPDRITDYGTDFVWILCNDMSSSASYLVNQQGKQIAKFDEYITDVTSVGETFVIASNKRIARISHEAEIVWQLAYGPDIAWPFSDSRISDGPNDDLLAYFYGPISDSGVEVWRLNPENGEVSWKTYCPSLGVPHSQYRHRAYLNVLEDKIAVISEGSWMFVEVLSAKSGDRQKRLEFESERQ